MVHTLPSFVLFDPANAPARLYQQPLEHWRAGDAAAARTMPDWLDAQLAAGREVALFLAFEAAGALAGLPLAHAPITPLIEALSFARVQTLADDAAVDAWLATQLAAQGCDAAAGRDAQAGAGHHVGAAIKPAAEFGAAAASGASSDQATGSAAPRSTSACASPAGLAGWRPGISAAAHTAALQRIAAYLAAGDCYQIDYTFPMHARAFGHPLALYRALRRRQPTAYRCLAYLGGDGEAPAMTPDKASNGPQSPTSATSQQGAAGASRQTSSRPSSSPARAPGRWVLSLSPELFFTLQSGGQITARPMKGTAPRQADAALDAQAAQWLAADPKNRAENLMILDLLRNDLGRIATPGSVHVPRRFSVEPYAQVWQMTSSVSAELATATCWRELWAALFPCGSVVGAPKHRSMQIIGALEPQARGLYTGAIGWVAPLAPRQSAGPPASLASACANLESAGAASCPPSQVQAVFSVAIRTLEIADRVQRGTRAARLGLGSGVVADSDAAGEWAECLLKARFAIALDPGFGLIETFAARWLQPGDAGGDMERARIDAHLRRLASSARYFGFRFDRRALLTELQRVHAGLPVAPYTPNRTFNPTSTRTRIELRHDGQFSLVTAPLAALPLHAGRVRALLAQDLIAESVLDPGDLFLRHKTTHRARFDAAWKAAESGGAFDALFFNRRGELCEGGRSSVFVKLGGRWFTPPLRCGLLPGVARAAILANPAFGATERIITRAELLSAEELMLTNALRGTVPACLQQQPRGATVA